MKGCGSTPSPCGACKFLRRKCVVGCVFAAHFRHEEGASHFAAIHKVFGASNVTKLLAHLPNFNDRCEAALTISYEAQARLQDPIYGCVSHIFALQQQVVDLQEQLFSLKKLQAENNQNMLDNNCYMASTTNPNFRSNGKLPFYPSLQDVQDWFHHSQNPSSGLLLMNNNNNNNIENPMFAMGNYNNYSYNNCYYEEGSLSYDHVDKPWLFQDDVLM